MKVVNDLVGYKNLKIIQETEWFNFSLESVLLPRFVSLNMKHKKIIDFCTGNGPIPLILSTRTVEKINAIEIQRDVFKLARESLEINNLSNQIKLINDSIENLGEYFPVNYFDVITCNPPYFKVSEESKVNLDEHKKIARHEIKTNLEQIIAIATRFLNNNGIIAISHRADRLSDLIEIFRKHNLEPKKLQFLHPKDGKKANIVLIEAKKTKNKGIEILSPIIVHNEDGSYTDKIKSFFINEK